MTNPIRKAVEHALEENRVLKQRIIDLNAKLAAVILKYADGEATLPTSLLIRMHPKTEIREWYKIPEAEWHFKVEEP